jgi:hypothetical protein
VSLLSIRLFKTTAILGAIVSSGVSVERVSLAQPAQHFYVANVTPPDDYLPLRPSPSLLGYRIAIMPSRPLVDFLERQGNGWWRLYHSEVEGWAPSGVGQRQWIVSQASQDPEFAFRTPSNNIHCLASTVVADGGYLRCDLKIIEKSKLPTKEPCELASGDAFAILANGKIGEVVCHGDTVIQQGSPVLQYGQAWRGLGFTCQSNQTGLTCSNAERHGFFISRTAQRLF